MTSKKKSSDPERVVCAANYVDTGREERRMSRNYPKTGLMFCGWRHGDCIMLVQAWWDLLPSEEQERIKEINPRHPYGVQGFMTSTGRYVSREEGLALMLALGPLPKRCGGDHRQLFSENLY